MLKGVWWGERECGMRRTTGDRGEPSSSIASLTVFIVHVCSWRRLSCHGLATRAHWPHQKLLGDGLSTPITPFSLICTISSELSVLLD